MGSDFLNTKQLAEYLDINEKKIYSLITLKKLPATKITGKWLFPKNMVDAWINNSVGNILHMRKTIPDVLMITGSDDPVLEYIVNKLKEKTENFLPYFSHTGSLNGLLSLKENKADICCCHLLDSKKKEYNLSFINSCFQAEKIIVINYAYREQGLLIKKNNPHKISGIKDITRPGITYINRQKGSGTRLLLDEFLLTHNITGKQIKGYDTDVTTHLEVGLAILNGEADCGLGIKNIANRLDLGFIPLTKERFDLILKKENYFLQEIQDLLNMLRSDDFKHKVFDGYDLIDSGKMIYSS